MAFYGSTFIYDGVPSEEYGLQIINFETGLQEGMSAGASTIIEEYQIHRTKPYFYKRVHHTSLEFEFTVGDCNKRTAIDFDSINRWMLGRSSYKKLQIVQGDMVDTYFNVIFINATPIYVGNFLYAIRYTAHCDSGFGWSLPKYATHVGHLSNTVNVNLPAIYNDSAEDGYVYPVVRFKSKSSTGLVIKNLAEPSRLLSFTGGLLVDEVVTIDNINKIITSNQNRKLMQYFSSNWLRLLPGENIINLYGRFQDFIMVYQFSRKIGA